MIEKCKNICCTSMVLYKKTSKKSNKPMGQVGSMDL